MIVGFAAFAIGYAIFYWGLHHLPWYAQSGRFSLWQLLGLNVLTGENVGPFPDITLGGTAPTNASTQGVTVSQQQAPTATQQQTQQSTASLLAARKTSPSSSLFQQVQHIGSSPSLSQQAGVSPRGGFFNALTQAGTAGIPCIKIPFTSLHFGNCGGAPGA